MLKRTKILLGVLTGSIAIISIAVPLGLSYKNTYKIRDAFKTTVPINSLTTFSKNKKNIVYLWSDEVTGAVVYDWFKRRKKESKKYADFLTGATIYKNVTTKGISTNQGVPLLYGGFDFNIYNKDVGKFKNLDIKQFNNQAYKTTQTMMKNAGYSQQYHSIQYFGDKAKHGWHSNSQEFEDYMNDKDTTGTDSHEVLTKFKPNIPGILNDTNELDYYALNEVIDNAKVINTSKPIFKSINTQASHSPYWFETKPGVIQKGDPDLASFTICIQLTRLIKKLKKEGIYDNTMIILASDHGSNQWPKYYNLKEAGMGMVNKWDRSKVDNKFSQSFRMNPALMIKPFGATGDLKFNEDTFLSIGDIPQIIARAIGSDYIEKHTDSKEFLRDPLNYVGDRSIEVYGSDWHYIPKDRNFSNIEKKKYLITNNFWDVRNWKYADYGKTNWQPFVIGQESIDNWGNFIDSFVLEFEYLWHLLNNMSMASRILEPQLLRLVNVWKDKAKQAGIPFNITLPLDYDEVTFNKDGTYQTIKVGTNYLTQTIDALRKVIYDQKNISLLKLMSKSELTVKRYK